MANKKAAVTRVYLPPDANCLLSVMDHCLRSLAMARMSVTVHREASSSRLPPASPVSLDSR